MVNNIPPEMFFRGLLWRPHERYLIRGDSQSALAYRQARNPMARRIDRTGPDTDVAGADGYVTKLSGDADCQAGQVRAHLARLWARAVCVRCSSRVVESCPHASRGCVRAQRVWVERDVRGGAGARGRRGSATR